MWGSLKIETDFFGHWTKNLTGEPAPVRLLLHHVGLRGAFSAKKQFGQAVGHHDRHGLHVAISLTFGTLGGYALARPTAACSCC